MVSRNFIQNNGCYGVRMDSDAERTIVAENNLFGNTAGHIDDNADPTNIIVNNVLY